MGYGIDRRSKDATRKAVERAEKRDLSYPPPKSLHRRRKRESDLKVWLKHYLAESFPLPFSKAHEETINRMQACIEQGGMQSVGLFRGAGKTTITKGAVLWAVLSGRKRYALLVGATARKASAMLSDIKTWLRFNDRLLEDYPEVCVPVRALEGVALRARAQTANGGTPTLIEWGASRLRFPSCGRVLPSGNIVPSDSHSAIIDCDGLTGDIRGHSFSTSSGKVMRPDLAVCDDPQTRESSKSKEQTDDREQLIKADVAASAGPDAPMSVIALMTIINRGDLADRLLNPEESRDWRPVKSPMIIKWPVNMDLWKGGYKEERITGIESEDNGERSRKHYETHKQKLSEGAEVAWPDLYDATEVDALQHAMNLYFKHGERAFSSEYQLDPLDMVTTVFELDPQHVARRVNGSTRRTLNESAAFVVGFCDINADALRWAVAACTNSRCIGITDYGMYPGMGRNLIESENPTEADAVSLLRGLSGLDRQLSAMRFTRGKEAVKIDLMLLDCGGVWMQSVFDWIGSVNSVIPWHASRGWTSKSYRPSKARIGKPGEQWHRARWPGKGKVYVHDADYWRMRQQKGWMLPIAAPDAISFFGGDQDEHRIFAEQVCSEKLIEYIETDYGALYKWDKVRGRNDFGDVATGLYVAASICGAQPQQDKEQHGRTQRKKARVVIGRR